MSKNRDDEEASDSVSSCESDDLQEQAASLMPGKVEPADVVIEASFEEETERAVEVAERETDDDLVLTTRKLEKLSALFDGRYQDILAQIIDGRKFVIDGDSLLLLALETNGLSMEGGAQTLHITYIVEKFLSNFIARNLNFVIVFFEIWNKSWSHFPIFSVARNALKLHLSHNQDRTPVLIMDTLWSSEFSDFLRLHKPGFIMMSTMLPDFMQESLDTEKGDIRVKQLQFTTLSQAVFCEFLCLDVVDINSVHDTPASLMATVFVHVNQFKIIFDPVFKTLCRMERQISFPTEAAHVFKLVEQNVKVSAVVSAAASLLSKIADKEVMAILRTVLLSLAYLELVPLKRRCFKDLPGLPVSVLKILSSFQGELANVVSNLSNSEDLIQSDFRYIGDLWQGTAFIAVFHTVCQTGVVDGAGMGDQLSQRYEKLVAYVNELLGGLVPFHPYPFEHICEGQCSGHVLNKALPPISRKMRLIPTTCKLTDLFCGHLASDTRFYSETDTDVKDNVVAHVVRHWHNKKPLTDEYDRIPDSNAQKPREENKRWGQHQRNVQARFNTLYGLSLEGRSSVKAIVTNSGKGQVQKKTTEKPGKSAKGKISKKDQIIQDNMKRIMEEKHKQVKERLKSFSNNFSSLMLKEDYRAAIERCDIELQHAKDFWESTLEILLLKAKACFGLWKEESVKKVPHKNFHGARELFLVIRDIFKTVEDNKISLNSKQSSLISSYLHDLGFNELASMKGLPEPTKGSNGKYEVQLNYVEFQLAHLGAELVRDTGGKPDPRADGFVPDPWQVKLFDIIDKNESAVVVAPTSSGKTYASYYCMEKVIKNNDDDVVVYVCPTKALVNQVHATIYARFKKNLPPGKTLQGIFTRDYRQNVRDCQILTTVPECLEMLLLSPRAQTWVKRVKYVIFDEVHCLLGQSGGLSWENAIMLIRCPFLALSATIHKPETFCSWLQKVEDFKKVQAQKFNLMNRPLGSYKVSLVVHLERHNHLLKNVMLNDGSIKHVHPYSFLNLDSPDAANGIPKHIVLSPDEALQLYNVMKEVLPQEKIINLSPVKYFQELCLTGYLSMQAVQKFSTDLRVTLENEDMETKVKVLAKLKNVDYAELETGSRFVYENIPEVLKVLKERGMLPALVFTYDRSMVQALPLKLLRYLRDIDDFTEDEETDIESESDTDDKKAGSNKVKRRFKGKRYVKKLGLLRGPSMLKSEGSLRGEGFTDEKLMEFIERRLMVAGHKSHGEFASMLRRGLGKHFAGMSARERGAVEMLFRLKILNCVSATGTLALGIHMPCKTVVIAGDSPFINVLEFNQMSGRAGRRGFDKEGNVIFYGLNQRKLETLMTGNLPEMIGNFPLNASLILRLLLLVSDVTIDGKSTQEASDEALVRAYTCLENGLLYELQKDLKNRMKYFMCFVVQLLLRWGIISDQGVPYQDALFLTHLHYHEPGNFAFHYLLKSDVLEELCVFNKEGNIAEKSLLDLMVVLNFLFARIPLSNILLKKKRVNSVVVLPPLPEPVYEALKEYNREVLDVFSHFFSCVSADIRDKYGVEKCLPLCKQNVEPDGVLSEELMRESKLGASLADVSTLNDVCSVFAGLSGNTDQDVFPASGDLIHMREDINVKVVPTIELDFPCNSYALDFYKHGIPEALVLDNGLKAGHDFTVVKDFMLVLQTLHTSLSEMLNPDAKLLKAMETISNTFSQNFQNAYIGYAKY
ncbi:hypothetical protein ONE63_008919 [Megalurothrips usitatus]|uniref:ATP-dependent RNA helicase DDX60 n=1 Tax=Megalurothrips usitatus TaxID=439358 RepID=A0AAV7XKP2_9NEOP|nr:hypothetical protein ONE63_008919 [Megalurothrips usitatus]